MTATAAQSTATAPAAPALTRREFLYYIWGASMALFMAQSAGALVWFAVPRFPEGTFGGDFTLKVEEVPPADSDPKPFDAGRFWLVNIGDAQVAQMDEYGKVGTDYPNLKTKGVKALYKICVHLGCLYKWVPTNRRFECPCHGSKYLATGARVDGPANRNLDTFVIEAVDAAGNVLASTDPAATAFTETISLDVLAKAAGMRVKTGKKIQGETNSAPGGGR